MAITAAQDVGGFGRLAEMKFKKRAEAREERRLSLSEQAAKRSAELAGLQIKQTEANLQKIQRQAVLKDGLSKAMSNIPEGENQYTTGYNYFMSQGAIDEAMEYQESQSKKIEDLNKIDPVAAADLYNKTIGRVSGTTVKPPVKDKKYGKVYEGQNRAGKRFFWHTVDGVPTVIEGFIPPSERPDKKGTWGAPKEGVDETGKPIIYTTDKEGNVKVLEGVKPSPKKGMKIYDREGNVMVDMSGGPAADVPRGAKTGLFKDVVAAQATLDEINSIENIYEPEFLTYGGMFTAVSSTILNKMDPENRSKFTQRRAAFMSAVNQSFIRYRKWATGVAGGEKEMAEIKRSVPNENDSPQDFESKLALRRSITRRLMARQKAALKAGINNEKEFKAYIKAKPLDEIPTLQERGDRLETMGYNKKQILNILKDEGYIR